MESKKRYFKTEIKAPVMIGKEKTVDRFLITSTAGYFPVIAKTKSGKLVIVYRDGDIHVGQRGYLKYAESIDNGESWSRGSVIADEGVDIRNPAFCITEEGIWIVCYAELDCYENGKWVPGNRNEYNIFCRRSLDEGSTWLEPTTIFSDKYLFSSPYGKIITGSNDELIMNIYGKDGAYIARSYDKGKSWGDFSLIKKGFNETSLLSLSSEKIIALLRSNDKELNLWQSNSMDGGYSWSEPKPITSQYQHPADLLELDNGDILLAFSHRKAPFGVRAVISRDGGEIWDFDRLLVLTADAASKDCGYPSSIQLDDASIYTAYYADSSQGLFKYTDKYQVSLHAAGVKYSADIFKK